MGSQSRQTHKLETARNSAWFSRRIGAAARSVAVLILSGLLLWLAFRSVNLIATLRLLERLGPWCLVSVVPSLLALSTETWAWQQTFRAFSSVPPLLPLLRVRVITESLCNALPLGPVWSEGIKPHLLAKHCGLDLATSLTGMAARKYLLLLSQGFYLLLGFTFGYPAIQRAFVGLGANQSLAVTVLLAALVLVLAAEFVASLLGGGKVAQRALNALSSVPLPGLRSALTRFADRMVDADGHAVRFFVASRPARWLLSLPYLGVWLLEAGETWLILVMVGAPIDFSQALAVEAVVVLARHLLFVLPAGLGAQELGYALFLATLGVSAEYSAAFALIKRTKELLWILVGYLLWVTDRATTPRLYPASGFGAPLLHSRS